MAKAVLGTHLRRCLCQQQLSGSVPVCPVVVHRRGLFNFYKRKYFLDETHLMKLYQKFDISPRGLQNYWDQNQLKLMKKDQEFRLERYMTLGADLAAAVFVVERQGRAKVEDKQHWYSKNDSEENRLPNIRQDHFALEGLDLTDVPLLLCGMDNLAELNHLKYIKMGDNKYVTDWYLVALEKFKDTLEFLDLSNNPNITDSGLASLQCLRNLKCLNISNCAQIKKGEVVCSYLEELIPDLTIIGLDTLPVLAEDWATSEIQHNRFMYLGSSVDPVNTLDIVVENDSKKDTHLKGPQVEEYEGIISLMKRSLYAPN